MPACAAVPQATTITFLKSRTTAGSRLNSSSFIRWFSSMRPNSESATALGCSEISLSMKRSKPPFSTAAASQSMLNGFAWTGLPEKSVTSTESARRITIWSCPSSSALRVCSTNAATSDARKLPLSPKPTTSGEFLRAPTTRSGCSRSITTKVNAPSRREHTACIALGRSPPSSGSVREIKWATTSVSVSDCSTTPSASSSERRE